jgi:hypothetical protein
VKKIISLFFVFILSLPILFGLNHFISEDHIVCHDQEIHFHEKEIECSTCDFLRLNFDYKSNEIEYSYNQLFFSKEVIIVQKKTPTFSFVNCFYLRGPPSNYLLS